MKLQTVERSGPIQTLLDHPSLVPLVKRISVRIGAVAGPLPVQVPASDALIVAPGLPRNAAGIMALRFGLELAWLSALPRMPPSAACLLAARCAGLADQVRPAADRARAEAPPFGAPRAALLDCARRLAGKLPPPAELQACHDQLRPAIAFATAAADIVDGQAIAALHRLWDLVQPTEALLVAGGDDRLRLDDTGLNKYGCAPIPRPEVASFASCTASSISAAGLAAAEQARQALVAHALREGQDAALDEASHAVKATLLDHYGVADLAEIMLAASGTDATLLLTGLLAAEHPDRPLTSVLMSPYETGSGVPEAVQGRHFAPTTAAGNAVEKGRPVHGFRAEKLHLATIALRRADGCPIDPARIAADTADAIEAATRTGRAVLHAIDGSKTGLTAPDRDACLRLAARFGPALDIVVDACQARLEPATIRFYLEQGWPVLLTGSKFFGAPGFCGAILFPRARLARIVGLRQVPAGLDAYVGEYDGSVSRKCAGLLLRWTAALHDMGRFAAIPPAALRATLDRHGLAVRTLLMRNPDLALVAAPRPALGAWSCQRSVFTFTVRGPGGWLSADALRPIYLALNAAPPHCLIGQPVHLGGSAVGGLRIALSADQVIEDGDLRPALGLVFGKLNDVLGASSAPEPALPA